jgi:hypothetical protein
MNTLYDVSNDYEYETLSCMKEFYKNYGIAILKMIKSKYANSVKTLKDVVLALQKESARGDEECKQMLLEIYMSGVWN